MSDDTPYATEWPDHPDHQPMAATTTVPPCPTCGSTSWSTTEYGNYRQNVEVYISIAAHPGDPETMIDYPDLDRESVDVFECSNGHDAPDEIDEALFNLAHPT